MERYVRTKKIEWMVLSEEGRETLAKVVDMVNEITDILNYDVITINKIHENGEVSRQEFNITDFEEMANTLRFATFLDDGELNERLEED